MHNDVCVHIQIMLKEQTRETEKVEKQGDFLACQGFICGYMLAYSDGMGYIFATMQWQ